MAENTSLVEHLVSIRGLDPILITTKYVCDNHHVCVHECMDVYMYVCIFQVLHYMSMQESLGKMYPELENIQLKHSSL